MTGLAVALAILIEVVAIFLVRKVARAKGRMPGNWALATLLVGPVVLLAAVLVPRRESVAPDS